MHALFCLIWRKRFNTYFIDQYQWLSLWDFLRHCERLCHQVFPISCHSLQPNLKKNRTKRNVKVLKLLIDDILWNIKQMHIQNFLLIIGFKFSEQVSISFLLKTILASERFLKYLHCFHRFLLVGASSRYFAVDK